MDQGIKSRPRYQPLERDEHGRRHLLLLDHPAALPGALGDDTHLDDFDEVWAIRHDSRALPTPGARMQPFRAPAHLFAALSNRLAHETMGFRLYAAGAEPFLWDVFGLAQAAGMSRAEVRLVHLVYVGSSRRRVFCVHCRTLTDNVATSIVACAGCGASLFVRDHFSRRMSAFMGIQIDSEVPGEVPAPETLYA